MAIYEYSCQDCGSVVEKIFKPDIKPQSLIEHCQYCESKTNHQWIPSAASINYLGVNHSAKVQGDLKNRFDQIRKHYPAMKSTV